MPFEFQKCEIEGLISIIPHRFKDNRGEYRKTFEANDFKLANAMRDFTETSILYSKRGALRGLHYQTKDSQAKLVQAVSGKLFDVALDLRDDSPTFGRYHYELLDAEDPKLLLIPEGFAHGFISLTENSVFCYQCSGRYLPDYCGGILWNDPQLAIPWPLKEFGIDSPIVTSKDASWPTFDEYRKAS